VGKPLSAVGKPLPDWGPGIETRLQKLATGAADGNDWNDPAMRKELFSPANPGSLEAFFEREKSSRPCHEVIAAAVAAAGPLTDIPLFSCAAAWKLFASTVVTHYRQAEPQIRQKLDFEPYRAYLENPLDDPGK